jgi:hypothetical protein
MYITMIIPKEKGGVVAGLAVAAAPAEPLRVHGEVLAHRQDGERETLHTEKLAYVSQSTGFPQLMSAPW